MPSISNPDKKTVRTVFSNKLKMVIWMSVVAKKSLMAPKETAQSIDTLPPVYSLIIFSVTEAIFPCHKNLETVTGGHLE